MTFLGAGAGFSFVIKFRCCEVCHRFRELCLLPDAQLRHLLHASGRRYRPSSHCCLVVTRDNNRLLYAAVSTIFQHVWNFNLDEIKSAPAVSGSAAAPPSAEFFTVLYTPHSVTPTPTLPLENKWDGLSH